MEDNTNDTNFSPSSLILTARYGHESSRLIHLIEKNLYIVIGLIVFTAVLSIVNALGFHYIFEYSEDIDFLVDIALAVILIAVVIPLFILLLRSRRTLDGWDDMFVSNTLSISIGVAMAYRAKEEAFRAIMESVEQINQPLNDYVVANKSKFKEFMDITVDKNTTFDILIDSDHVLNGINKNISDGLRNVLKAYGAIVVRILDSKIERISLESYVSSLSQYVSKTRNQVGLAVIIGEEISVDTQKYSGKLQHKHRKSGKINNIILVEKPSSTLLSSVG